MESFENLFSRKMDRKEFLVYLGMIFLSVTGIFGMMNNLTNPDPLNKRKKSTGSYGSQPYGGIQKGGLLDDS